MIILSLAITFKGQYTNPFQFYCNLSLLGMFYSFLDTLRDYERHYDRLAKQNRNHKQNNRPVRELADFLNELLDIHYDLRSTLQKWQRQPWWKQIAHPTRNRVSQHLGKLEQEKRVPAMIVWIDYGFTYSRQYSFFKEEAKYFERSIQIWEKSVKDNEKKEQQRWRKMEDRRRREQEEEEYERRRQQEEEDERRRWQQERQQEQLQQRFSNLSISSNLFISNWYCQYGHKLAPETTKIHHSCNICRQSIGTRPSQRCQTCDFDVCGSCVANKDPSVVNTKQQKTSSNVPINIPSIPNWWCKNKHKMSSATAKNHHTCNICRFSIGEKPSLRCQACDFDVCNGCYTTKDSSLVDKMYGSYFKSQKCKSYHQMKTYHRPNRNSCDVCKASITTDPFLRCQTCNYDVCKNCNNGGSTSQSNSFSNSLSNSFYSSTATKTIYCPKGHTTVYYPEGGQYQSGRFNCNVCKASKGREKVNHCAQCQWDACDACRLKGPFSQSTSLSSSTATKTIFCPKWHTTVFYPQGGQYQSGVFICNICKGSKGREKANHCPQCQWDVCESCRLKQ